MHTLLVKAMRGRRSPQKNRKKKKSIERLSMDYGHQEAEMYVPDRKAELRTVY